LTLHDEKPERSRVKQIFRSSSGITLLSLLATSFAFFTQMILAARFGAAVEMDAYLVSTTIPLMVTVIFAGSLNYTFIPFFVESRYQGREAEAWKTVNNLCNLSFIVFLSLTLIGFIFTASIVDLIAPGLPAPAKTAADGLFRIQLPMIAFSGISAILSGVYYAEKRFLYPSLAALLNSACIFTTVFFFSKAWGIQAAAWGGITGSAVNLLLLLPVLFRIPKYSWIVSLKEEGTVRIIRLISPLLFGAIFFRADNLIQRYIASSLPQGSISYLGYAYKLVSTVSSLVVSGVSIVFLQHVSELTGKEDTGEIGRLYSSTFQWLTFLTLPIVACMIVLGDDTITVLFQRGRFDAETTHATWLCLMLYSGVMYGGIIGSITTPVFYAYKNTRGVVVIGIAGALLQILLSFPLAKFLSYAGLPLAYSLANLLTIGVFMIAMHVKYAELPFRQMAWMLCSACSAAALTTALLRQFKVIFLMNLHPFSRLLLVVPLVLILYVAICLRLKIQEAGILKEYISLRARKISFRRKGPDQT
jgi:putative peptidoglycan lipid II flippase